MASTNLGLLNFCAVEKNVINKNWFIRFFLMLKKLSLNFNYVSLKIPNDTECGLERAKSYQVLKRCRSGLVLNL